MDTYTVPLPSREDQGRSGFTLGCGDRTLTLRGSYTDDEDAHGVVMFTDPFARNGEFIQREGPSAGSIVRYPVGTVAPIVEANPNGSVNLDGFTQPGRRVDGVRTSLEANYALGNYALTAIGAFNREHVGLQQDSDFTTFPSFFVDREEIYKDSSLEARLASPQDRRLRWTAGYYYLDFDSTSRGTFLLRSVCLTVCLPTTPGVIIPANSPVVTDSTTIVRDDSIFAGLFFDLTEHVTASVEGRYQHEKVSLLNRVVRPPADRYAKVFTAFLPRVNVQWKLRDDLQIYVLYSLGNNPGGFNTSPIIGTPGSGTTESQRFIKEEKLRNYELGLKSLWLDRRLLVNAAIYKMDWTDQQVPSTFFTSGGQGFFYTENKGSSEVEGAQLELQAQPGEGWELRATLSYNLSKYREFCSTNYGALLGIQATPTQQPCVPVDGNRLEGVPKITGSFGVGYEAMLTDDWQWSVRGDYQHQDGMLESEMHLAESPGADVFNLSFGVRSDKLAAQLYCHNCTNDDSPYRISRASDARAGSSNQTNQNIAQVPRRPRQLGLRLSWDF